MKREGADGGRGDGLSPLPDARMPLIEEMADVSDGPSGAPRPRRELRRLHRASSGEGVGGAARDGARGERRRGRARRRRSGPVRRAERAQLPRRPRGLGRRASARATVARAARDAGAFPNAEASGWNTEYRAQLEHAMGVVRDSKEVMKNLKTIRRRKKDIDEGVEVGHLRGKSAKEANRSGRRASGTPRTRTTRREAKAKATAEAEAAAEREGPIAGLKKLPDFITRGRGAAPRRSPRRTTGGSRRSERAAEAETPSTRRRARRRAEANTPRRLTRNSPRR